MDNNPATPPVETPPVETPEVVPEYSYKDVHDTPAAVIATNDKLPEDKPAETPAPEKPKPETPAVPETPTVPTPPAEPKVELDPKELAKDVAKEVVTGLSEQTKEEKDKYQEFFDQVQKDKGREPNWIEVARFLEDQAVVRMEKKQAEVEETKAKEEQERKEFEKKAEIEKQKYTEEYTKRFNNTMDEELGELGKTGALTPIKDSSNPNDPGVIERKALFQAMFDENLKRSKYNEENHLNPSSDGFKPLITSVARIYYGGYYTKPTPAQPAGGDAPVSMGDGSAPSGGEGDQEIDYVKDIHNKPFSFFGLKK